MKAILVPVEQHTGPAVLHATLTVARIFGSYIEGIASAPSVPEFIIADVGIVPDLNPKHPQEWVRTARRRSKRG